MQPAFTIVPVTRADCLSLGGLCARFRAALRSYKGLISTPDAAAGCAELTEYVDANWPVYAAKTADGQWAGYIVLRTEEPLVWVESLFVEEQFRRSGIASALFARAEEKAAAWGETTVFNYVHPNNHGMIAFLRRHGYTVLNLIEIRKPWPDETLHTTIAVGNENFDY